ncbi:hypothetical protein I3843_01G177100 [Carya illinoinensis]|uniref:Photolyase/cryptochrome alpha/beta domain-containing protein n=1 Tax=Carya illinoinensis TaxID=32201 RepID=A0A922K8W8_CARIL|nr:hypothetical protein I3842_01G184600 [Carya illinoinensis]KAG6732579.1 hypothetical protein I3842_01G184600 [Carya illinoinensis]KAG7996751.1 hypothetical protein I3843_01G177100 [Carya illinoinensis]KAG7996767.1 hypothetical protein I3843_01G177100 [Carya illinoinensis]
MGGIKTVVWFRRDLRIEDNPALAAAARDGSVFPVYIWCPKEEGQFYPGRVSRWWLKQSLAHLERSLKSLGAELMLIKTDSTLASLFECIKAVGATKVVFNHLYGTVNKCSIGELGLEDESEKSSNALLGRAWFPGWSNADKALTEFVEQHLLEYSKNRLRVEGNSTSLLSPYLHHGELSVRKVFQFVRMKQVLWTKEGNSVGEESVTLFLKAIGLREYSRYLCFNFPFTHERSLLSNLKFFPWHADQAHFKAWRQGRTGYPLVDAGMRELWATGWIHNQVRVIVSSFAVKVLLLPWKWGMKYFWDTLLDADIESDILGWQYISGSLPDGHELERLDSPEIQGSKFDPEGEYVRHWLPELTRMPTEWIHHPWDAPCSVLKASGVDLGLNYPKPIVGLDLARERLSEAIFKMWEIEAAARVSNTNGANEVVVDNSDGTENLAISTIALKINAPCPTVSSNDQRVPTIQNSKKHPLNRKRSKYVVEEKLLPDFSHKLNNGAGTPRIDEDVCSTAESSSVKKQSTSRNSFSVPQSCFSSEGKSFPEYKSSDLKRPRQEQIDMEQSPSGDGGIGG